MSLYNLRKTAILRQWDRQPRQDRQMAKTSEAIEALKNKLISVDNAHKKMYKRFWYTWGAIYNEE